MFAILNRLRGTRGLFATINGIILGLIYYYFTNDYKTSILIAIGYVLGESFGWGKWIGIIGSRKPQYHIKEGLENGIHFIANLIILEKKDFLNYARLALAIRGFYWWLPVIGFMDIPLEYKIISLFVLSIGFPLSVEIGRLTENKIGFKHFTGYWEQAEVYYGLIQDIVLITIFMLKI